MEFTLYNFMVILPERKNIIKTVDVVNIGNSEALLALVNKTIVSKQEHMYDLSIARAM